MNANRMRYEAVLFDMDGVILDTEKIYTKLWMQATKDLGYELSYENALRLRACDSSIASRIITEITKDPDVYTSIRKLRRALMSEYLRTHEVDLKPGVKECLEGLKKRGVRTLIVTSALPDEKLPILEKNGIADAFEQIISVRHVSRNKPYPDVYLYACEVIGLPPERCLAIEDSPNGIQSAYDAGVPVVMVPDLSEPDAHLRAMCTAVVPRIDGILDLTGL